LSCKDRCLLFLTPERAQSRAGRTVMEAKRTLPTPTARREPRLKIPRWWATIRLPKPTMEVAEDRKTARPVLLAMIEPVLPSD